MSLKKWKTLVGKEVASHARTLEALVHNRASDRAGWHCEARYASIYMVIFFAGLLKVDKYVVPSTIIVYERSNNLQLRFWLSRLDLNAKIGTGNNLGAATNE